LPPDRGAAAKKGKSASVNYNFSPQVLSDAQERAERRLAGEELARIESELGPIPKDPLEIAIVRELTEQDLKDLLVGPHSVMVATQRPKAVSVSNLKASHHKLAQLVAQGMARPSIAMLTGFSTATIARYETDPAFQALVEHYMAVVELEFVDIVAKMRDIGEDALGILKNRIDTAEEQMTNREILEIIDAMITKPMAAQAKMSQGANAPAPASPTINISFKSPEFARSDVIEVEEIKG
jgi:hypothetical protein